LLGFLGEKTTRYIRIQQKYFIIKVG
jgi:hypothetical protein